MTIATAKLPAPVAALNNYLLRAHWNGAVLAGPDSGVRWNYRLGRFVKSFLPFMPWKDVYVFMQTQAYWILANWKCYDLTCDPVFRQRALACTNQLLLEQQPEGFWRYPPLPSRVGKVATVEGNFATIGLLTTYRRTNDPMLLAAAQRWHGYLSRVIGFQEKNGVMAVNYWANDSDALVPNNTTLTLWTLAELARAAGDASFLSHKDSMLSFLQQAQMASGELPYAVATDNAHGRPHFLCFQYNAFEFLDLYHYLGCTGDDTVLPIMQKLSQFLATGVTAEGAARYNCHRQKPETLYYSAAVATALGRATELGLGDYRSLVDLIFAHLWGLQRHDGGLAYFSRGDYGFLSDRRSYPRNLAMILYHSILELQVQMPQLDERSGACAF